MLYSDCSLNRQLHRTGNYTRQNLNGHQDINLIRFGSCRSSVTGSRDGMVWVQFLPGVIIVCGLSLAMALTLL